MTDDEATRSLFGSAVRVATMTSWGDARTLLPPELALVCDTTETRRREFAAGRFLARRLLRSLGVEEQPLLRDDAGRPLWPVGVTGSISHCNGCCVVAVAPSRALRGLGIDVERRTPLDPGAWGRVVRPEEWRPLPAASQTARGTFATLLLCVKESVAKCMFPPGRGLADLLSIRVALHDAHGFQARVLDGHGRGRGVSGRVRVTERHVLAGAWLPSERARGP